MLPDASSDPGNPTGSRELRRVVGARRCTSVPGTEASLRLQKGQCGHHGRSTSCGVQLPLLLHTQAVPRKAHSGKNKSLLFDQFVPALPREKVVPAGVVWGFACCGMLNPRAHLEMVPRTVQCVTSVCDLSPCLMNSRSKLAAVVPRTPEPQARQALHFQG